MKSEPHDQPSIFSALRNWARRVKRDAVALWFAYRDPQTPWPVKALCIFVVGYALSPIDLIPDWIPLFGLLDDLVIVPLGVLVVRRLIPAEILADCRRRAEGQLQRARRASRIAMALMLVAWVVFVVAGLWLLARLLQGWTAPGAAL